MDYRYPASASGSQSPSDEASSTNNSPIQLAGLVSGAFDDADTTSSPPQGTPNRSPDGLSRAASAGKGGCWTCRLRRKKCDEMRGAEDDSCETCRRLTLDCLGWGPKKPEWMRDKQAAAAYKKQIKDKLNRLGLIRGQPKAPLLQAPTGAATPPDPMVPSQSYHSTPGAGPSRTNSNPTMDEYGYTEASRRLDSSMLGYHGSTPRAAHDVHIHSSYSDTTLSSLDTSVGSFSYPSSVSSSPNATPHAEHFDRYAICQAPLEYDPQHPSGASILIPTSVQGVEADHVIYYFDHVQKLQFIFAGNSVTNVTYRLIVQEPHGAVTHAICALAGLHHARMQVAQGLSTDTSIVNTSAKPFFDKAHSFLLDKMPGRLTESDAIAALHLVTFSVLSGGLTLWRPMFDIACEWLAQTGIHTADNPKYCMLNMTAVGRIALKLTMWVDIISSLNLMSPPRYLALYHKLFGEGGGYWFPSSANSGDALDLRMDSLIGCPDEILLGIAEISTLAHWKGQELRRGSLSMRELIKQGDRIERRLRSGTHQIFASMEESPPLTGYTGYPVQMNVAHATMGAANPLPTEDVRQVVASIFRETAVLYLHTVLSEALPGVPEISESVDTIMRFFNQLPTSIVDRALVFPICMTGCMTDDRHIREVLTARLDAQEQCFGNLLQTRHFMEGVWQQRDLQGGGAIDWRELNRIHGWNLLLI